MARTAALWQCLNSARDFFSAYLAIPPQNLPCMPFHSVHLSFCVVTATRLLFLGDESVGGNPTADPDWNPLLARESMNLEAIYGRLCDFFGEADRVCAGLGRRVRYLDQERSILIMFRDKIRWMRDWYVGRTRSPAQGLYGQSYPTHRAEEDQGRGASNGGGGGGGGGMTSSKDAAGEGHLGSGDGPRSSVAGGSSIPNSGHGQPMDIDYAMPGELDEGFWQAMFDWGWNGGMDLMDVQG